MALRLSTFLRNYTLGTGSVKTAMAGGYINIYSGTQPSTADTAVPGGTILLATIYSVEGSTTGINLDTAVDGAIPKASGETWTGTTLADGTAGWFRYYELDTNYATSTAAAAADDTSAKVNARIDGSIAVSGADMNISNTAFVTGAVQTVNTFTLTLPTL